GPAAAAAPPEGLWMRPFARTSRPHPPYTGGWRSWTGEDGRIGVSWHAPRRAPYRPGTARRGQGRMAGAGPRLARAAGGPAGAVGPAVPGHRGVQPPDGIYDAAGLLGGA